MTMFDNATGPDTGNRTGKFLTFALSTERYGLEIRKVQEIIGVPSLTKVPRCPDYLKGVINLRGKIIPLIDLRIKFGMPPHPYDEKTCVVVVNVRKEDQTILIGVVVDTVLDVIHFGTTEIESAPDYGAQVDSRYILGMGKKPDSALNILIDIERALLPSEVSALAELT